MSILKEFKEFAVKGNMMDMAIGIIIGASFNKVIDILVKKVLMPPLSLMSGSIDFEDKRFVLQESIFDSSGVVVQEEIAIGYGLLLEALTDFLIIGFTVFIVVKAMNRLRKRADDTKDDAVETPKNIQLLSHLTELLEEQNELLRSSTSNDK